jgi:hypothetical protein
MKVQEEFEKIQNANAKTKRKTIINNACLSPLKKAPAGAFNQDW